jgi:hypothetical protein
MAHLYIASSQAPTAVSHTAVGHFTSPLTLSLVLAKVNRLEVLTLTEVPEGANPLTPLLEVPVHGRITALDFIRVPVRAPSYPPSPLATCDS